MPKAILRGGLVLLAVLLSVDGLSATTGMVAVQFEVAQAVLSPLGMERVKQLAADIETALLDRLFEEGHIGFNVPAELHLLDASPPLASMQNLRSQTNSGGGEVMILCRVKMSEPVANAALTLLSVTVSTVPIVEARGSPQTWNLPVKNGQVDQDFMGEVARVAMLVVASLNKLPESALALGTDG